MVRVSDISAPLARILMIRKSADFLRILNFLGGAAQEANAKARQAADIALTSHCFSKKAPNDPPRRSQGLATCAGRSHGAPVNLTFIGGIRSRTRILPRPGWAFSTGVNARAGIGVLVQVPDGYFIELADCSAASLQLDEMWTPS